MRSRLFGVLAIWLLIVTAAVGAIGSAGAAENRPLRHYVIGFRDLPAGLTTEVTLHGADVDRVDRVLNFARVSTRDPRALVAAASKDARVRYIEPDPARKLIEHTPNDPKFGGQYGLQHVRAPETWDTTLGDMDASVCIVDTGVRYTHEDIAGPRWLGGFDYINNDGDPNDDHGHGTHVAGTAAASIDNALGVAGVANVGVFGVKVLDRFGVGTWAAVASGIRWCADNAGPRVVISMSLSGGAGAQVLQEAVAYAYSKGALLVAAAGNLGPCSDCIGYPAKYPEVIAVTCTTSTKSQCGFSSDGPESELTGPGSAILSTWNLSDESYNTISGTSMSTPHISGVAALVWSEVSGLSNLDLRQRLRAAAQDLGTPGWDELYGYGLVDAKATLDAVPSPAFYDEDFDDGAADGWTVGGLWHIDSACPPASPSAPNYLGYHRSGACDFDTGARTTGNAQFELDLTGAPSATLEFMHRFEKENYQTSRYDIMRVQVNTGSGWTTLKEWSSRSADQPAWGAVSIDLTPYAGGVAKLRFLFDSVNGNSNAFDGWLIDNVEVTADVPSGNDPPIANAGPDQTVSDDDGSGAESVTLDGTGSSDPDGSIDGYEWTESGSTIGTDPAPTVELGAGAHTITLTVTDDAGETASDDVVVTVQPNQQPSAGFTFGTSDLTVDVDGATSSDPDGSIASYAWDWGDGDSESSSSPIASHTYSSPGTYLVALTVTDNGGATDSTSTSVTVPQNGATLFAEDFDDGDAGGWQLGGLWHISSACSSAPSQPNYLGYHRTTACDYVTGGRTQGTATVDVDLTGRSAATLEFMHRFEKENYGADARDNMTVMVSTNGGSSYTTLQKWSSRSPDQSVWTAHSVDLTSYVGGVVKLRFRFDSVNGTANDFSGWHLDDIAVTSP